QKKKLKINLKLFHNLCFIYFLLICINDSCYSPVSGNICCSTEAVLCHIKSNHERNGRFIEAQICHQNTACCHNRTARHARSCNHYNTEQKNRAQYFKESRHAVIRQYCHHCD